MPIGIYKHKPQQGFQKGHKIGIGNTYTLGKHIHSEGFKEKKRTQMLGNTFALGLTGEKSSSWKGGIPNCLNCGKKLSTRGFQKCKTCNNKEKAGEKHPNWKGGYKNTLMLNKKRRILKLNAEGTHTFQQWEDLKKKYAYMCLCCKQQEPFIALTEDHIIPLSKGGSDNIENIQPLCQSCNSRKSIKIINFQGLNISYAI